MHIFTILLLALLGTANAGWYMPDESEKHKRTWMTFGATADYGAERLAVVRKNLALVANVIAENEPVYMIVREEEMNIAREMVSANVTLVKGAMDDIWARDTGPTFVQADDGSVGAVNFNFNGWGNKQAHSEDKLIASFIAKQTGAKEIASNIVIEGGSFEVDGKGTAIISKSCVIIDNRNPGKTKADILDELKRVLGVHKIIWIPGIAGQDITDGHTDFYARFSKPGVVLAGYDPDPYSPENKVTLNNIAALEAATDVNGKKLKVIRVPGPTKVRNTFGQDKTFAAGYIGYYVYNGALIVANFGDTAADNKAYDILKQEFPDRKIIMVDIDGIASGGGSIHCATQQEPEFK